MTRLLKSSFFRRFVGGFALGAVGMLTLQPAAATRSWAPQAPASDTIAR